MELKELRKNLNKLPKNGFWLKCEDLYQIMPLIESGTIGTFSKDGKWRWVFMYNKIGSKQGIKEFITVLNIKIKQS